MVGLFVVSTVVSFVFSEQMPETKGQPALWKALGVPNVHGQYQTRCGEECGREIQLAIRTSKYCILKFAQTWISADENQGQGWTAPKARAQRARCGETRRNDHVRGVAYVPKANGATDNTQHASKEAVPCGSSRLSMSGASPPFWSRTSESRTNRARWETSSGSWSMRRTVRNRLYMAPREIVGTQSHLLDTNAADGSAHVR